MNPEHIIPLALGGCNGFCIQVDKEKNSMLGSKIDGKFSNDFLISSLRRHKNLKGHSGKEPTTKLVKTKIQGSDKPVQLNFIGKKSHFYDPVKRRVLDKEETQGITFQSQIKFDLDIRMRFTAKVLLAAGYYLFGDTFKEHADHGSLRKLMNYKISETKETIKDLPVGIMDDLHIIEDRDKGLKAIFELMCNAINGACVIFFICTENIIGTVGIGGKYIATINFKAQTEYFPKDDHFRQGHILGIQENQLKRSSFYDFLLLLNTKLEDKK